MRQVYAVLAGAGQLSIEVFDRKRLCNRVCEPIPNSATTTRTRYVGAAFIHTLVGLGQHSQSHRLLAVLLNEQASRRAVDLLVSWNDHQNL